MQTLSQTLPGQTGMQRSFGWAGGVLLRVRDWLDARGRFAWVGAMVLGFIALWPVGLAILGYMIWSNRMFTSSSRVRSSFEQQSTGNSAFDAYRDETLRRLEDEHREFVSFLEKLRDAKDKSEFDQFMDQRRPKTD